MVRSKFFSIIKYCLASPLKVLDTSWKPGNLQLSSGFLVVNTINAAVICTIITIQTATRNNTDGNKLVIFSGIALYYGDNYILSYK